MGSSVLYYLLLRRLAQCERPVSGRCSLAPARHVARLRLRARARHRTRHTTRRVYGRRGAGRVHGIRTLECQCIRASESAEPHADGCRGVCGRGPRARRSRPSAMVLPSTEPAPIITPCTNGMASSRVAYDSTYCEYAGQRRRSLHACTSRNPTNTVHSRTPYCKSNVLNNTFYSWYEYSYAFLSVPNWHLFTYNICGNLVDYVAALHVTVHTSAHLRLGVCNVGAKGSFHHVSARSSDSAGSADLRG